MIEKLFTLSFEHWKERVGEAFSKPFLSRGVEILDGGFARSKVNIDVSRIHIHSIVFFFSFFFSPLPSIEYEDIIGTVVGRFELLVSSVSIVGRDELE